MNLSDKDLILHFDVNDRSQNLHNSTYMASALKVGGVLLLIKKKNMKIFKKLSMIFSVTQALSAW